MNSRSWAELTTDELYSLLKLRTDVFYVEQSVDDSELDGRDREPTTRHYWIEDAAGAAAYLRVLVDPAPEYKDADHVVGRVVVRSDRRGEGLAQALFARVFEEYPSCAFLLHAQEYIAPLYAKLGFAAFGEGYMEAGIPHMSMYRRAPK